MLSKIIRKLLGQSEKPTTQFGAIERVLSECKVVIRLPEREYRGVCKVIEPGFLIGTNIIPGARCTRFVMNDGEEIPLANGGLTLTKYDTTNLEQTMAMRDLLDTVNDNRRKNGWRAET